MADAKRLKFQPGTRGDLRRALAPRGGFATVAPESPRPVEMTLHRSPRARNDMLTADDQALFECLVSLAYDDDRSMPAGLTSVAMGDLARYLGGRPKRDDVKRAFSRLKATEMSFGLKALGRYYENVSLLEGWVRVEGHTDLVQYSFPGPIRELMSTQQEYAYIELAALPGMESKYSANLYRRLAYNVSRRPWKAGGDNRFKITYTPEEIADLVGFPRLKGKVQPGKLRERFLSKAESDLSSVKAFSTSLRCVYDDKARGRPLKAVEIEVTVNPSSHRLVRALWSRKRAAEEPRIGGADLPQYRVDSVMWRKGSKAYKDQLLLFPRGLFELWSVAFDEALRGEPLTDGYGTRAYRGAALLEAIRRDGANEAAWGLLSEEADNPDLAPAGRGTDRTLEFSARIVAAEERRRLRVDWKALSKKATAKDSAPAPVKDSPTPPTPIRKPAHMQAPAFLTKEQPAPAPTPAARPEPARPLPSWMRDIGSPERVTQIGEHSWSFKPARPPARPEGMPVLEGGNVDKYKADMEAWLAAQRQAEPVADPLDD